MVADTRTVVLVAQQVESGFSSKSRISLLNKKLIFFANEESPLDQAPHPLLEQGHIPPCCTSLQAFVSNKNSYSLAEQWPTIIVFHKGNHVC